MVAISRRQHILAPSSKGFLPSLQIIVFTLLPQGEMGSPGPTQGYLEFFRKAIHETAQGCFLILGRRYATFHHKPFPGFLLYKNSFPIS